MNWGGDENGTSKGKFFPWFLLLFAKKKSFISPNQRGKTFEKISTPLKHLQLPVGKLFSKRGGELIFMKMFTPPIYTFSLLSMGQDYLYLIRAKNVLV